MRAVFGCAVAQGGAGSGGARVRSRRADRIFTLLSRAADHSLRWVAISASLAVGGPSARRGAVRGLAVVAVTSVVTNVALRPAFRRQRPRHRAPLAPRPGSFSFPSGHSASAFAFATVTSWQLPGLVPLLVPLAGAMRRCPASSCQLRCAGTAEKVRLTQLSVINAPVFGGPLQLSVPASDPDDRLLDMLAVEDITPGRCSPPVPPCCCGPSGRYRASGSGTRPACTWMPMRSWR